MRALMTSTRTATSRYSFYLAATTALLTLVLLLGSWASKSHAYGPELEIDNFIGIDLGYYDMYSFAGTVKNSQDPASLTVTIYINGQAAATGSPDAAGHFDIVCMCVGGEVVAETYETPFLATATITVT